MGLEQGRLQGVAQDADRIFTSFRISHSFASSSHREGLHTQGSGLKEPGLDAVNPHE